MFSLSQSAQVSADLPLRLVNYLSSEFEYLPWNVFLSRSKFYTDMLDHTRFSSSIQKHFSKIVKPYYSKFNDWYGNDTSKETWLDRY